MGHHGGLHGHDGDREREHRSVAPGVAAALTTTVAGLAVAIPALAGYNYLMNRVRSLTVQMENFSSEFLSTVERNFGDR